MALNKWFWPFLWVLLAPAISVPLSILLQSRISLYDGAEVGLGNGGNWATSDSAAVAFLPGLLNLLAFAWLFLGNGRARWAALWAGIIGVAGALLPFVVIVNTDSIGQDNVRYVFWTPTVTLAWVGVFDMWLAALGSAIVFRGFVRLRDRARAPAAAAVQEHQYLTPVRSH